MVVFQVFKIVPMILNPAKHHKDASENKKSKSLSKNEAIMVLLFFKHLLTAWQVEGLSISTSFSFNSLSLSIFPHFASGFPGLTDDLMDSSLKP